MDVTCNGYANRETYALMIVAENDAAISRALRTVGDNPTECRAVVEDVVGIENHHHPLTTDLLNASLNRVNWDEVASHFARAE